MDEITLKTERVKAIATIIITAVVNVLNVIGYAVDADVWINLITSILACVTVVWCWWFNQNMTQAAVDGQKVINAEKERE